MGAGRPAEEIQRDTLLLSFGNLSTGYYRPIVPGCCFGSGLGGDAWFVPYTLLRGGGACLCVSFRALRAASPGPRLPARGEPFGFIMALKKSKAI